MDKLEKVRLTDLCEVLSGGTPKTSNSNFWGGDIPWASVKDFNTGNRWFGKTDKTITVDGLNSCSSVLLHPGDLILSARGTVGVVAQCEVATAFNQSNYGIRAIDGVSDGDFLYYLMSSLREKLVGDSHGGMFDTITRDTLNRVEVPNLSLIEQQVIGRVLGYFDHKIRINQQIASTMELIAQTIFKSWFVDFDPVHAKARGEQPVGMDAETAALFPDSFEDSELGPIPTGWQESRIAEICKLVVNGSTPSRSKSSYWTNPSMPWFRTGELADGFLLNAGESISEEGVHGSSVKVLPARSVLMAIYAAPTVGRLGILTADATFNQACTGMVPKDSVGTWFLFLTLKDKRIWFNSLAIGAAQQNISKAIVENCPLVLPPEGLISAFNLIVEPFFVEIESLAKQNESLSKMRDSLLLRLISGELEIPTELLEA